MFRSRSAATDEAPDLCQAITSLLLATMVCRGVSLRIDSGEGEFFKIGFTVLFLGRVVTCELIGKI